MTHTVIFSERAERQLDVIFDYVAERSGEPRADAFVGQIVSFCESLEIFPERGGRRDDLRPGLRILGYRRVVSIAFIADASNVVVLGIFYGGQFYDDALREDDDA